MVLGNNGLITKAKDAKTKTEQDQANTETGTIDGGEASEQNPTIPEGYTPINTEDAKWDAEDGPEYNNGLVITDDSGNEWVWVPVADVSTMYTSGEATLLGTSGDTAVTTSGYSNLRIRSGDSSYYVATTPGNSSSTDVREPDLLSSYDTDSQYYKDILDFESVEEMGEAFVADYEAMIASVSTYHGFYIGRYELTADGEKAGAPLTNTTWYNLYKTCRDITGEVETGKGQATMIWGCQWDETVSWLNTSGGYNIDTNSSSWGNYSDSTGNAAVTNEDGSNAYGTKQNTGYSEYWKANNIYDLAGNCFEWTQEVFITNYRVGRGGNFAVTSSVNPASGRGQAVPNFTYNSSISSRATLYVK